MTESYSLKPEISSLDMSKNMCTDCTNIMKLMLDMFSHKDTQDLMLETLKEICLRFPIPDQTHKCEAALEKYLPSIINSFLSFATHKEGELCMFLGLCSVQPETPHLLQVTLETGHLTHNAPSTDTSHEVNISPQCTFCLFLIKKIEDMLPKERTEETVVKLLEKICDHLPQHYQQQCNDFLENYGKQLIDFLLTSATPHTICMLLHLCLIDNTHTAVRPVVTECDLCRRLVMLTQLHLAHNATGLQVSSTLRETCFLHPNAAPGCEAFISRHAVTLLRILGKQEEAVKACQVFFCKGRK